MNDKTFFRAGIFFLIIGAGSFLMIIKPWQTTERFSPPKKIQAEKKVVYLNVVKNQNIKKNISQPVIQDENIYSLNYIEKAEDFLEKGMFTSAIKMAEKKRETDINNSKALQILIDANMGLLDYIQAENFVNQLLAISNTPQNIAKKIEILMLSGKKDEAKKLLNSLPKSEEKVFYQMIIAVVEEKYDEVKNHANHLIRSKSQYAKTAQEFLNIFENYKSFRDGSPHYLRTMLANMLNILDYHILTIEFIKPTLEKYPDYRDAWILMGNSYLTLKKFSLSQTFLEKAVSLDPSHPKSPYFLAIALAELGQFDDAIEQFNNALKNGYTPIAKIERYIADLYVRQEKFSDAVEHYQEAISDTKNAKFSDYIYSITLSINNLHSPDLALKTAMQMNKKFPHNPRSLPFLAWTLIETGNINRAKKILIKSIETNPELPDSYLFMGELYEKEKRFEDAFSAYKKGYKKGKGDAVSRECAQRYNTLKEKLSSQ